MSRVLSKNVENHSRDLLVRTDAERAWMWRMAQPVDPEGRARRVANHMTQQEAATLLGISRAGYKQLEDGRKVRLEVDFDTVATTNSQFDLAALRSILQKITEAAEPTLGQLCALARRRSGRRIGDLAAELGTTRVTYLTWENESDPRLVEWWRDQGYTFPITPLGSRVLAMRRRSGMRIPEVAAKLHVSQFSYLTAEANDDLKLVYWWADFSHYFVEELGNSELT